jgi:hypothetical protein
MYPVITTHATSTAHSSAVSRTFSRRLPGTANVSNETAKVPGPKVWLVMSKKRKKERRAQRDVRKGEARDGKAGQVTIR